MFFLFQPRFSKEPLENDKDVNKWLKFYEMKAPLVSVGVFESIDPVKVLSWVEVENEKFLNQTK